MIRTAALLLVGFAALVASASASTPMTGTHADRNEPTIFRPTSAETGSADANLVARRSSHRSHRSNRSGNARNKKQHHGQHHNSQKKRQGSQNRAQRNQRQ